MSLKGEYLSKLDKIPTISFNKEQKQIAKSIIENTPDKDLDAVYGLITQRVKTGFVFDEAPEVNHNAVALIKENKDLGINVNELNVLEHKLIIGENYDALKNLCATYIDKNGKGLIDVIYIDPPYNTEATKAEGNDYKEEVEASKFVYRDKFTRDGWLNMMNERLKLAKRLLSDVGVIFISIDDSEQAYLKVLCDDVFGYSQTDVMIWRKSGVGRDGKMKNTTTFRKDHEYIIVCYKGDPKLNKSLEKPNWQNEYGNPDNDKRGPYKAGSISNKEEASNTESPNYYSVTSPNGKVFTRQFNCSKDEFEALDRDNRIFWGKDGNSVPSIKIFVDEERFVTTSSLIDYSNMTTTYGSKELFSIIAEDGIGERIRPKPSPLLKKIIQISSKKDSIVLDFFAGSGTTGQAVMELNEKDGGQRKFILVTNNENGIGENITRERLYRVIKGKGSNGENIDWTYKKEKPYLTNNSVRVFNIETEELTLQDLDKAEKLKDKARLEFKKLNENINISNDFDIYNELSALNPQKK